MSATSSNAKLREPQTQAPAFKGSKLRRKGDDIDVVFVAQFFPPAVGGVPTRNWALFRTLRGLGLRCVAVTCEPLNQASRLPRHDVGSYVFFTIYCWLKLFYISLTKRYGTIFLTVPPPTTSLFIVLAKALRKRIIVDIQDLWPDILLEVGYVRKGSFVYVGLEFLGGMVMRYADSIITVSSDLAQKIRVATPKPISVVRSLADPRASTDDKTSAQLKGRLGITEEKVLLYIGTLGRVQRFESMISAMPAIIEAHPDVRLIVVGSGDQLDNLRRLADSMGLGEHVRFLSPVPHEEVPDYISIADVCLLPLDTTEVEALPTKFFEYMACGKPVLGTSSAAVAKILSESGGGVFVKDPRDRREVARATIDLLSDRPATAQMGERGREYARKRYDLPGKLNEALQV